MRSPVQQYLEDIARQCGGTAGEVAAYIPELAAADPDRFGLALATVDGQVYEVGDTGDRYSIQSISKPFTYALALADRGRPGVAAKVDVEPSGEAFNEISVSPRTNRPRNPMINAGAITAASLVGGADGDERFERVRRWYGRFAGRELELDEQIHASELATGHRNRAIAHMLREFGILEGDPEETLDQYVRQCSVSVSTRDLALMAATLANGGQQPVTGERILDTGTVEQVLSVMATCGMYDAAGDWLADVGMPAKSGVSGAIIAVLPGQVGLAVFSPRLDEHGNSARGVQLCERMSRDMEMHLMHVGRTARTAVRASYPLADLGSRRRRPDADTAVLDTHAERARIYELHGDLLFSGAEHIARAVVSDDPELAVFDLRRVDDVTDIARRTLLGLRDRMREVGAEAVSVDPRRVLPDPDADTEGRSPRFDELDAAVRWCEDELLRRHGAPAGDDQALVDEHPLLRDLSAAARTIVDAAMHEASYAAGEVVLEAGGGFAGVHVIVRGEAVATVDGPEGPDGPDGPAGPPVRLVTLYPGTSFGELALGTDGVQETAVRAVTDLEVRVLAAADLDRITREHPEAAIEVWQAMCRDGYRVADRALHAGLSRG